MLPCYPCYILIHLLPFFSALSLFFILFPSAWCPGLTLPACLLVAGPFDRPRCPSRPPAATEPWNSQRSQVSLKTICFPTRWSLFHPPASSTTRGRPGHTGAPDSHLEASWHATTVDHPPFRVPLFKKPCRGPPTRTQRRYDSA